IGGAAERIEIARLRWNEHRHGARLGGEIEHRLVEAEHEIRPGAIGAAKLGAVGGVDADDEAGSAQRNDRFLELAEGRSGQTTEIDDVGALAGEVAGADENLVDREERRLDDLGEDADVVAAEVGAVPLLPEMRRQVVKILRAALYRQVELVRQRSEVAGTMAWHDDAVGGDRLARQAPADEVGGHQRR